MHRRMSVHRSVTWSRHRVTVKKSPLKSHRVTVKKLPLKSHREKSPLNLRSKTRKKAERRVSIRLKVTDRVSIRLKVTP